MSLDDQKPKVKERPRIDWSSVRSVLVVKLRSIGDTVLATPSLIALRRFLPDAQIDVLLEDWVAPVLEGFEGVNVIPVGKTSASRARTALDLRRRGYDVAFNLHGGTTATFFIAASGARHRVGYTEYRYSFLYNHLLASSSEFWGREKTHSAEQQLALLGHVGIPVDDRPKTRLSVTDTGVSPRIREWLGRDGYALIHPATAFATKQWAPENFARTADLLAETGLDVVAISSKPESHILDAVKRETHSALTTFDDLTLPEITALASEARIFVGNDSGIAHIAAAVSTPSVIIFGSSNRAHWGPWTDAPNEIVYEHFECQPCHGYSCDVYGEPRCIQSVSVEKVSDAIRRLLGG